MENKKLCVFCGSSRGEGQQYLDMASLVGQLIVNNSWDLVYGGADIGVMGAMADAVLEKGGKVYGVMPKKLVDYEVAHSGLTEFIHVETMHERKQKMYELSDGFLILPGGLGTLDELFEIMTWAQLKYHEKPIYLWNQNGFFDHLIAHLKNANKEGFIKTEYLNLLKILDSLAEIQI